MIGAYRSRILLTTFIVLVGCTYKDIPQPSAIVVDCTSSTFAIAVSTKVAPTTCLSIDGRFTMHASGGAAPYLFSFNGASFQGDSTLSSIGPGTYLVTARDANLCQKTDSVKLVVVGSTFDAKAATTDDKLCLSNDGTITVTATGGTPPYRYQFGTGAINNQNSFSNLKFGYYTITVRDTTGCLVFVNAWVHRGDTQISYNGVIKNIIETNCATIGCHNGDNGPTINWLELANVQRDAQNIKMRTANHTMPPVGSLTQDEIDQIACWVDDGAKAN